MIPISCESYLLLDRYSPMRCGLLQPFPLDFYGGVERSSALQIVTISCASPNRLHAVPTQASTKTNKQIMYGSKSFLFLLLVFVTSLPQNDAQTRKLRGMATTNKIMVTGKEGPRPTQTSFARGANAPTARAIGGGRPSHVRYTKKIGSSPASSARAAHVADSPKRFTIRRPAAVEVMPQESAPNKASSKKKSQKSATHKAFLSFEKPLLQTALTTKERV